MLIPPPFNDELLFSRLIRHIAITGTHATDFLIRSYGTRKASIHPTLTAGLSTISKSTAESSFVLLSQQTLAPLFTFFLPQKANLIKQSLLNNNTPAAIRACQLPSFKLRESLTLKFCPTCAIEDIQQQGAAFWHRSHQILGIEACHLHGTKLLPHPLPLRQRLKANLLPSPANGSVLMNDRAKNLALFAHDFLNQISSMRRHFHTDTYLLELKKKGLVTPKGRVSRKEISSEFYDFSMQLKHENTDYLPSSRTHFSYISGLLEGLYNKHPFMHLLFSFWLFGNVQNAINPTRYSTPKKTKPSKKNNVPVSKCLNLLKQGLTLSEVSRQTQKSSTYLKLLAAKHGIKVGSPPKKLNLKTQKIINTLAWRGFHRNVIASRVGLSSGTIEQEMSSSSELIKHRRRCRYESKRRRHRIQIFRYMTSHPEALRKDIRKHCSAAYAWFYLNERAMLEQMLPKPSKAKAPPRVNWQELDDKLQARVQSLMQTHKGKLSRTALDRLLGNHGWLTKRKDKLPKALAMFKALQH